MMIKLSALDQSPIPEGSTASEALAHTARLAQELEKLRYQRFWVSEHHFTYTLAGTSPEVLISHLGAKTEKIRIGSGGVMLPHYSAYKVAENFRLLEALYPNRIDLGVGRAPGGMPIASRALQEGKISGVDQYPEQLDDLIAYIHDALPENHPFAGLQATPIIPTVPELWLLGSSGESAKLAAQRGAAFAFAHFINGQGTGTEAMQWYQRYFKPSIVGDQPKSMVAIFVVCAETEEEANKVASSLDLSILLIEKGASNRTGVPSVESALAYPYSEYDRYRIEENRNRMIVGNPEQVKQKILQMSKEYNTDEFMLVSIIHDFEAKLKSYQLVAKAFGL